MKRSLLVTSLTAAALTLTGVQPAAASPQTQTQSGWALDRIDQAGPAQQPYQYTYTATGSGVDVYIVDSEINTGLGEFGGRAAVVYDGIAGQAVLDGDRVPCGGDLAELDPHGTEVAAVAGGTAHGVAKGANLLSVVAVPCGSEVPSLDAALRGLKWIRDRHAANPGRPAVVNVSLNWLRTGCLPWDSRCSDLSTVANQLADAGVLVTVSAGNQLTQGGGVEDVLKWNACNMTPSDAARATVVAASDGLDRHVDDQPATANSAIHWSSAGGVCVDLYAPGKAVDTVDATGTPIQADGTSYAAPMVAGMAALYKQTYGDAPTAVIDTWLKTHALAVITGAPSGTPNLLLNTAGL
ncbi:S8 family serine peptidase [Actinocorallia aurea]